VLSLYPKTGNKMEEKRKNTYSTFEDKAGNIYHITRNDEGRALSATREKDGKFFYMVEHEDGRIDLISEEQEREMAEEHYQTAMEYSEMLAEVGGDSSRLLEGCEVVDIIDFDYLIDVPDDDGNFGDAAPPLFFMSKNAID
jgi:hypothetical protein